MANKKKRLLTSFNKNVLKTQYAVKKQLKEESMHMLSKLNWKKRLKIAWKIFIGKV